jgi:hypothetical protein
VSASVRAAPAPAFSPDLVPDDALAQHWLGQVTVRLRREVLWLAHQRTPGPRGRRTTLPPPVDPTRAALDLLRYAEHKQRFFARDETARYLSDQLAAPEPDPPADPPRGSFAWVDRRLGLAPAERFLLALALLPGFDSAAGAVVAACLDDARATHPTLTLAQRLWDDPAEMLTVADGGHRLRRHGLLEAGTGTTAMDWREPLVAPDLVVRQLLFPGCGPPALLRPLAPAAGAGAAAAGHDDDGLKIVPVLGPPGADHAAAAPAAGRHVDAFDGEAAGLARPGLLSALACLGWLRGRDVFLDLEAAAAVLAERPLRLPDASIGAHLLLAAEDGAAFGEVPASVRLPAIHVPPLTHERRLELWREQLGDRAGGLDGDLADVARRFRFEAGPVRAVCRRLAPDRPVTRDALVDACRAELELDLGGLAEPVRPRFRREELVLPARQSRQLDEIAAAMRSLAEVHYGWGTARAWDEAGLAVLFAGAPGTGKTMAAEVLAGELGLPLYRVDLSQVVNKYIGETEKNLRRVFDACEAGDAVVLFDEADALFGRRTQVRDAHDRYANLEVSYLLSRMERAKGLTILATNRKEDLDAAFLRRLRYLVDFPLPDAPERRRIWAVTLPDGVDASEVDVAFLGQAFPLTGGHIRSAVLNACLQSAAAANGEPQLRMEDVIVAVRRELDKAERRVSLDRFGPYADVVRRVDGS